ncbi:hypothetical protein Q4575_05340 [Psychrosphaera sp. 1_MG-2023]|uniref:hypothetical protein n=1 Tax=Psychrosphaera sp. 1_MG-2023 TaxID=3062643 RepID=UPI0026E2280E|nr:hypothetical protein [Psychrosphaera sp. 1_MG-2023]MDO6718814.1 hypothetical protein [Psychrosphaera sp. 1_MG-2023]
MNLRDKILSQPTPTMDKVHVKAWNVDVFIKPLTIKEHEEWESLAFSKNGKRSENVSLKASLVIACAHDESGTKIFTNDDIGSLSELYAEPINKLFAKCSELNGLTDNDVKELEGN